MRRLQVRGLSVHVAEVAAVLCIIFMVLIRLWFSLLGWPGTDSEEGTMGLMALHIAQGHDWPIFYYGQNYMGAAEAYVAALMFHITGVSLISLRLAMLSFVALFGIAAYALAALLYGRRVALISLVVLSLAPRYILTPEMRAVGGAVETLAFGTLAVLLASWLVLSYQRENLSPWKRRLAYLAWGLVVGLGLWSHWLVLPFVFVSALLLLLFCWREWSRGLQLLLLLAGLGLGALPLIIYNLHAPAGQNSLSVFLALYSGQGKYPGVPPHGLLLLLKKLDGTFLYSLPLATGMSYVCPLERLPLYGWQPGQSLSCSLLYGGWSLGYMTLLTISLLVSLWPLWKLWRAHAFSGWHPSRWPAEERQALALHSARLLFLLGGVITLLAYAHSLAAAQRPQSMRYLVGMVIITPALLWPVVHLLPPLSRRNQPPSSPPASTSGFFSRRSGGLALLAGGTLLLILLAFIGGTLDNIGQIPTAVERQQQYEELVGTLTRMHIHDVYSGYWVCDRLTFASQEHIICGTIDPTLGRGTVVRYPPYYEAVHADPMAAYLFSNNSEFPLLSSQASALEVRHYRRITLDGFILYVRTV